MSDRNELKILIASWGLPRYDKVTYIHDSKKYKANTTTAVLKECYNPDHTLLIFLDSLLATFPDVIRSSENYRELTSKLLHSLKSGILKDPGYLPSFDEKKDRILIAPASGTFFDKKGSSDTIILKGRLNDYYYWIYYHLSGQIFDWVENAYKESDSSQRLKVRVFIDITHSINFASTLAYRALREILPVLSFFCDVKLQVFNSEPYKKGVEELTIHNVESINVSPVLFKKCLVENGFYPVKPNHAVIDDRSKIGLYNEGTRQQFGSLHDLYKQLLWFTASVLHGIPLGIYTFFPETPSKLGEHAQKIIEFYLDHIETKTQSENGFITLEILRKLYFHSQFEAFVYSWNLVRSLHMLGIKNKAEVSLREISEIPGKLYARFPVINNRIADECDSLRKSFIKELQERKIQKGLWTVYKSDSARNMSTTTRNFFAHAGLAKNTIEYRLVDGEFFVRYHREAFKTITDYLKNAIST